MRKISFIVVLSLLVIFCCSKKQSSSSQNFCTPKRSYVRNKKLIDNLVSKYWNQLSVYYIRLEEDNSVSLGIKHQIDDSNYALQLNEVEINSEQLSLSLRLYDVDISLFEDIIFTMRSIDCYWIAFRPKFNGDSIAEYFPIELGFLCDFAGKSYSHSIIVYDHNLTDYQKDWFHKSLVSTSKGGIISRNAIWYYK